MTGSVDENRRCENIKCGMEFVSKKYMQVYCSAECWIIDNPELSNKKIESLL